MERKDPSQSINSEEDDKHRIENFHYDLLYIILMVAICMNNFAASSIYY